MDIQHIKAVSRAETLFYPLSVLMNAERDDKCSVAFGSDSFVCWSQFKADVEALTQALVTSPQEKWALCFDDSYHFAVAFIAAAYAKKHIILPGNHQEDALAELATHFDVLLHDRFELCKFIGQHVLMPSILDADATHNPELALSSKAESINDGLDHSSSPTTFPFLSELPLDKVAITLFTSGSSGQPKAVTKTLECVNAEIVELEKTWGELISNSRVVSTVSHQHIYGLLFRVLWPLCAGRPFGREDLNYPEQVMVQATANTVLITSPALLKRLFDEQTTRPYRAVFSSGGPLSEAAARQSHALFSQLPIEVFGSTETGGMAYRQQHQASTSWTVFDVIDVALNADGCLRVCSPFIDPDNWYQTSDQCQLMGERHFALNGRSDRVVKVEEKRISLTEVEHRLCQLSWVEEAAVLTVDDSRRVVLAAVITLTSEGQQHIQAIGKGKFWLDVRQQLRRWLEPVGIPRRFREVAEIPLNSQGKRLVRDLEQFFN
ncbi:AMP-binding protein [Photobacterium alginatilyticum]|uniref:Acyl-CoA synthetase n=1 Tax=Photobacterium alginatilyticum TaxID=1775171 RepID=A0ABW9YEB2_9GAMM|nr:AMP-binding protein [Photobacterium alginatilyticum]NBI51958.1 acyl-CoA synthetase [Photobacterium alginatilyticum]